MEALFRKVLEKTQPFTDSKTLKIPKLTPMVRFQTAPTGPGVNYPVYFFIFIWSAGTYLS